MTVGILGVICGYMICLLIGLLGFTVLWRIWDGTIDLTRLISESNGDASMSRFQFLVFTFVIAMSLFLVIVSAPDHPQFPQVIPATVLALLGISGSSYLVSKGIQFSNPDAVQDRPVEVVISPAKPSVRSGQTQQFKADVPRKPSASLHWEVIAGYGAIDPATGLYTADLKKGPATVGVAANAPAVTPPVHATIQVTVDGDPDLTDLAVVTITA